MLRIGNGAVFVQDLYYSLGGITRHDYHHEHHRDHHQAHQDLDGVGYHRHELSGRHRAADYHLRREPCDQDYAQGDGRLHNRHVPCENHLRRLELGVELLRRVCEFLFLVVFTHVGLDHPHRRHVLAHHCVQAVVCLEYLLEARIGRLRHVIQCHPQHRNDAQIYYGEPGIDSYRHDERHYHHERGPDHYPDDHLVGVLNVGDVGGKSRNEASGRELVDVRKREFLDVVEYVGAEVLGEP